MICTLYIMILLYYMMIKNTTQQPTNQPTPGGLWAQVTYNTLSIKTTMRPLAYAYLLTLFLIYGLSDSVAPP